MIACLAAMLPPPRGGKNVKAKGWGDVHQKDIFGYDTAVVLMNSSEL